MVVYSSIGKTVHLRCSATAPFDTIMYWRRFDNQTISSQSSRYRQQQHMHHNHLQTTLYIRDVEIDDFGLYACYAESKAGRSQAVMELKQHRHPLTTIAEPTATVRTQILKRNKISQQTSTSGVIQSLPLNNSPSSNTFHLIFLLSFIRLSAYL